MHASAYMCIHAGLEVSVDATDPTDVAAVLRDLGELMPRAVVRSWCFGEFKLTGPWWYRVSNLETRGPVIGLWLVGELCARGWEVFQVSQGDPTSYHLRHIARSDPGDVPPEIRATRCVRISA